MTPEEFEKRAEAAVGGGRGWRTAFAAALGRDPSTLRRWVTPGAKVPDYAVALLEFLEATPAAFRPKRWLS